MKANTNFHNEYDMMVEKADREKVFSLFNKMAESKPGLTHEAKVTMKDEIDGRFYLVIKNMSAFDDSTKKVVLKFLNQFKYKKPAKID